MSDLEDFSHHVSEVPAGQPLTKPLQVSERVHVTPFPEPQGVINDYAQSSNWMSSIGSTIAAKSSNAIAKKIGSDLGKNPQGDMGIPITDFDKTMQESYRTQAQATLGLQANKLISDSNLEAAKADRITPDLIEKTNKNISLGLKSILQHAPSEIVPDLEYHYGNLQLNQADELTRRMIREQHEDRQNNTAIAAQKNSEDAYSFGLKGNDKAAQAVIETTRRLSEADVASRLLSPSAAKANIDTARKSYLSGKIIHDYENSKDKEGYLKSIADKKPSYLSDTDYMSVTANLLSYVNRQESLRSQDEQLRLTKFQTSISLDPMSSDMPKQLQDLKNNVSPEQYERAQLSYISAVKSFNRENHESNLALASWTDPEAFSRVPASAVNKGFDALVNTYVAQGKQNGQSINQEEAEVQVAAAAGGPVRVFVEGLKNKINSGNPAQMDSAARQMNDLYSLNASHALVGLDDRDKSIFTQYKSLRDSLPPEEAAKVAIQNANQDPDTQRMNKEKWSNFVKSQTHGFMGTPPQDWALRQVGLNKNEFINPGIANEYGNLILQKYGTLYQLMNGDKDSALKLTKQEVSNSFDYTGVNGKKVMTLHPIEKVLGYKANSDVVPFIQQDAIRTISQNFIALKDAYNQGKSNLYWEIAPADTKNHALLYGHEFSPIQIKRHIKTDNGIKTDLYNVVLMGNSFNWDISLQTDSGLRPLMQIAPYLGIQTYTPNKKAIDAEYLKTRKH